MTRSHQPEAGFESSTKHAWPAVGWRPSATVGDDVISATDHWATVKVSSGVQPTLSNETLSAYTNAVGYGVLKSCLAKRRSVESIVSALSAFPLAPFEGEKFSLGIRMRELRDADDVTKFLLLIDDAPPGLMSQTYLIERYTHSVLEGLLIVALVIGAADISFIATADTRPCGGASNAS